MTGVRPGDRIGVTGAAGFVGQALVEHLGISGYEVVGLSVSAEAPPRITRYLSDYRSIDLTSTAPELADLNGLVHLAGLAAVGPSFEKPQEYINTNSSMVTNIFEESLRIQWPGRAVVVSSGAVYGGADHGTRFTENSPTLATSPYVISKLLVEQQTAYYTRRGVDALTVRPFNHIGPGQRQGFIVPDLASKVAAWQFGTELEVGNLNSARDYTDVRDIVDAYRALLELPTPKDHVYNVCSGVARSGWEVFDIICKTLGKGAPPTKTTAPRAVDPSVIAGDSGRLQRETGWKPRIDLQTSIDDFVSEKWGAGSSKPAPQGFDPAGSA